MRKVKCRSKACGVMHHIRGSAAAIKCGKAAAKEKADAKEEDYLLRLLLNGDDKLRDDKPGVYQKFRSWVKR